MCGPESFVYDVRNAVAQCELDLADGYGRCQEIYLHAEAYQCVFLTALLLPCLLNGTGGRRGWSVHCAPQFQDDILAVAFKYNFVLYERNSHAQRRSGSRLCRRNV